MLSKIALFTDDAETLVAFYRRVLGQEPASSWPGGATFDLEGVTLLIHVRGEPQDGMPPNEDHFALRVRDVDEEAARLSTEAKDYDWGRSAYLTDPDGRLVELARVGAGRVDAAKSSREELLELLEQAHAAVEASQRHSGSVSHLTGDRRYQRQQQEVLKLLGAMRKRLEAYQG